jgi:two-component system CheB/CheR fusion protein
MDFDASQLWEKVKTLEQEVSVLKQQQIDINQAKELYLKIFEEFPALIWRSRLDKLCDYFNKTWLEFTGRTMEQEFGNGWTEGVHPDDFDLCLKTYVESFDKREAFLMEYRMKNKSGEYRWIRDFGRPFYDLDNSFLGYIGSCYDITEIKDNEMKLIELNATKDKFFSLIAHDLRGPFNALLGFTKLLEYELPTMTQDRIQKVAVTMRKSATNLYNLLENLLAWSQMERGVNTIIPESFSVMTRIIESMATIQELAIKKGIHVKYEINNDLMVFADSNMFATIIRNLTSNAIKFTPKGGNITIGAKPMADHWVEISITDTGIGMDQDLQENLFKLDVNTSRKGTEKEESTGLGLIICKGYIEKLGGRMWLESKEGQGSTFHFSLPGKHQNA